MKILDAIELKDVGRGLLLGKLPSGAAILKAVPRLVQRNIVIAADVKADPKQAKIAADLQVMLVTEFEEGSSVEEHFFVVAPLGARLPPGTRYVDVLQVGPTPPTVLYEVNHRREVVSRDRL